MGEYECACVCVNKYICHILCVEIWHVIKTSINCWMKSANENEKSQTKHFGFVRSERRRGVNNTVASGSVL